MIKLSKRKQGFEYWVNLSDIKITEDFKTHKPKKYKMTKKYNWYLKYGEFQSPIILDNDFILKDGYTSYLIAERFGLGKVPVYFTD